MANSASITRIGSSTQTYINSKETERVAIRKKTPITWIHESIHNDSLLVTIKKNLTCHGLSLIVVSYFIDLALIFNISPHQLLPLLQTKELFKYTMTLRVVGRQGGTRNDDDIKVMDFNKLEDGGEKK